MRTGPSWNRVDFVRPNIAITSSESAEALYDAGFMAGQIKDYADFEIEGFKLARFKLYHFDLDGLGSNVVTASLRREVILERIGSRPCMSVFHCGNHRQGIAENATVAATSQETYELLVTGSVFFRMGGNFLRLIHSVVIVVDKFMPAQILEEPPAAAKLTPDELLNFAVKNHKYFTL